MLWYILAGIAVFLWLVMLIPLSLTVTMGEDGTLVLCGRIFGLAVYRSPKKERPFKLSRYTPRALARRRKAELRKLRRAERRSLRKSRKKKQGPEISKSDADVPLTEKISLIRDIASTVLHRSLKHARVDVERLAITVATPDAARTAILYGGVCAALAALTEALHAYSHLRIRDASKYGVAVDYTGDKIRTDVRIRFSLRLHHVINIAAHTVFRAAARMAKRK